MTTETDDRLYLGLKGARERLCRAQVLTVRGWQSDELGQAIVHIDRVGAMLPQWSEYDQAHIYEGIPGLDSSYADAPTTGVHAGRRRPERCAMDCLLVLVLVLAAGCAAGALLALLTR